MRRLIYILCTILLSSMTLWGQKTLQPKQLDEDLKGVIYQKETVGDFYLHTAGFGFGVKWGEIRTYYRTKFYHLEFGNMRHSKEFKPTANTNYLNLLSRPYVYGKQNSFYVLRGGMGEKKYFSEKARRRGVAVGINYQAGPSIGIVKPYYLDLRSNSIGGESSVQSERYSEDNADKFLDPAFIEGYSGFGKGLGELDLLPGIHGKAGFHFAWGAYDKFAKALELGIMVDAYFKKIPIMVNEENKSLFINLYLNLQLGSRK